MENVFIYFSNYKVITNFKNIFKIFFDLFSMKILLSGGGNPQKTEEIDKKFLELCGKKPILYIPIAKKTRPFDECYSWMKGIFRNLGFEGEVVMWTNLEGKNIEDIEKFGGICIGGGNTFSLLDDIKKSVFDQLLVEAASKNIVLYGISAGAVVLGKDSSIALEVGDKDIVGLKDYSSLNLLRESDVWPHYSKENEEKLKINLLKFKRIISLEEGAGFLIEGKKEILLGNAKVWETIK
jgi:dipeptidase E